MKIRLKTLEECNALIQKANILLGYPNIDNGTLTYTDIPEITEIKDEAGNIIDSYYELEVSSEMLEQMLLIATEKLVEDTSTIDYDPEKRYEVKCENEKYLKLLEDFPEMGIYRKVNNIAIYTEKGYQIFYVNYFLQGHREILTQYLGVESIIDRQNGNE